MPTVWFLPGAFSQLLWLMRWDTIWEWLMTDVTVMEQQHSHIRMDTVSVGQTMIFQPSWHMIATIAQAVHKQNVQ